LELKEEGYLETNGVNKCRREEGPPCTRKRGKEKVWKVKLYCDKEKASRVSGKPGAKVSDKLRKS